MKASESEKEVRYGEGIDGKDAPWYTKGEVQDNIDKGGSIEESNSNASPPKRSFKDA
jgi:hypothetical protein